LPALQSRGVAAVLPVVTVESHRLAVGWAATSAGRLGGEHPCSCASSAFCIHPATEGSWILYLCNFATLPLPRRLTEEVFPSPHSRLFACSASQFSALWSGRLSKQV
jgi:hypothetical protein